MTKISDTMDTQGKSEGANGGALVRALRDEARKRGLVQGEPELSAELPVGEIFSLIRDMPYLRASSRQPKVILEEWRGTCSGKHYLLKELFQELGLEARIMMCTHQFTKENSRHFPAALRAHMADGPVPDVHTYIRLHDHKGWTQVDATWPSSAADLGMRVNLDYQPGVDMELACDPIDHFEVPENIDPQTFKEELIQSFCGPRMGRRELLIEGLAEWLGQHTSGSDGINIVRT